MFDIYIPTKGRAQTLRTVEHFDPRQVTLVVEPQEQDIYRYYHPNTKIMILDKSDQGLAYSRQSILEHAKRPFWMLDDDILGFYRTSDDSRNEKINDAYKLLESAGQVFKDLNVGQGGLEYSQFSWSARKDIALNSYCDACVWIDPVVRDTCHYNREMVPKEDRDFTLQVIMAGFGTARLLKYSFSNPTNGTNKGGLHEVYENPLNEIEAVKRMCVKYPGIVTMQKKKNGRIDCKIDWSLFRADS